MGANSLILVSCREPMCKSLSIFKQVDQEDDSRKQWWKLSVYNYNTTTTYLLMLSISLPLTFVGSWPAGHCKHTSPSFHRPCTAAVPPQPSTWRHERTHTHAQGPESVEVGFITVVRTHTATYVPPNQGQNHVYREEDESWAAKVVPHLLQCILLCTYDLKETAHTQRGRWLICGSTLMCIITIDLFSKIWGA